MMKKVLLLTIYFVFLIQNAIAQPEAIWQLLMDGTIIKWAYSGGDEFNGGEIDKTKWLNSYPWGRNLVGNKELEWYSPENNYEFTGSTLKLTAKKETVIERVKDYLGDNEIIDDGSPNKRTFNYTSGMVFSKRKYKYGLFEIRFKIPAGKGFWPAFWLYAGHEADEIDVFEFRGGEPNKFTTTNHWTENNDNKLNAESWTATGSFADGFNKMMLEWGPGTIIWYLNGQEFNIEFHDYQHTMWVIANLAIAGCCSDGASFCPCPDNSTSFPTSLEIDYIRIWTRFDCGTDVSIENFEQKTTDPTVFTGKKITMKNSNLKPGEYLNLISTEESTIEPETTIEGEFEAKIIQCPGPSGSRRSSIETDYRSITLLKDTINTQQQKSNTYFEKNATLMTVYPNPNKGNITIDIPTDNNSSILIEILNSCGGLIYKTENVQEKSLFIDISSQPKGLYFFKAIVGDRYFVEKLIIQ